MLKEMKAATMNDETHAAISDIRDAALARWLMQALEPVRDRVHDVPSEEAVERMRARVFGERRSASKTLAA
jgi:hypothetical protein